jgi:O-methyltransferase
MAGQQNVSIEVLDYVREVSLREDEILRELREESALLPMGGALQVMAEEGQLLALLVGLTGGRLVLDVGTFTGYSALCMARALAPGGRLITCELASRWPAIGASYWKRAGVTDRIDLRIGDASATLRGLLDEYGPGTFDLVFIDADKESYLNYYELALELVRDQGLIVADNTLFFGRVVDPEDTDPRVTAIRALNRILRDDERVDISLLPVADGLTLARKRLTVS